MKPVIGGDTVQGPCTALTGQFDGSSAVVAGANPSGRTPTVTYLSEGVQPTPNAVFSIMGNNVQVGGDIGLNDNVITATGGVIRLRKNGNYTIQWDLAAPTTGSNFCLSSNSTVMSFGSTVNAGTATNGSLGILGVVPHQVYNTVLPVGYRTTLTQNITVRNIADGTGSVNFVLITPPVFTCFSSLLVTNLTRSVVVQWTQISQNGQSTVFAPSTQP